MATEGVAMGHAVAVRTDYTADKVRGLAKRVKDAAQARRLLAIAAVLDGASRTAAARIGGMDRQTLRDWVIRFNDQGPDGLFNIPSPSLPPKLNPMHRAFLARIVEEGPIPAIHGVVRWRACDLISEGLQTGPRGHGGVQKNFSARAAEIRAKLAPRTPVGVWFQDEMRAGQKNKLTYRWARKGSRTRATHDQRTESTYLFGAVCPERGTGAALVLPACNSEAMQLHLDEIATKVTAGTRDRPPRSGW